MCFFTWPAPEPTSWDGGICQVYNMANESANNAFPLWPGSESYTWDDIDAVVKRYYNDARKGLIGEYADNPTTGSKGTPEAVVKYLAQRVQAALRYNTPEDFVRVVMFWLKKLALDWKVRPDMLWPTSVNTANADDQMLNAFYKVKENELAATRATTGVFGELTGLLQTLLVVGAVGAGVYFLWPLVAKAGARR